MSFLADRLCAGLEANSEIKVQKYNKVDLLKAGKLPPTSKSRIYKQGNASASRKTNAPILKNMLHNSSPSPTTCYITRLIDIQCIHLNRKKKTITSHFFLIGFGFDVTTVNEGEFLQRFGILVGSKVRLARMNSLKVNRASVKLLLLSLSTTSRHEALEKCNRGHFSGLGFLY